MEIAVEQLSSSEELSVIQKVLSGDKNEFRLLVHAFQSQTFALIMRMIGDDSAAREITQETFLRAYVNLGQFRNEARFSTWLTRIAINLANTYLTSKEYRQKHKTIELDENTKNKLTDENQFDRLDRAELKRLEEIIRQLSPKLREVCILCGLEQRSYQETATILQIPIGTVRSRLNRARCEIRKLYFEDKS